MRFVYPHSINHFRTFMDDFVLSCDNFWKGKGKEILYIEYLSDVKAPAREGWHIAATAENPKRYLDFTKKRASISAHESVVGETTVVFHDAVQIHGPSEGGAYPSRSHSFRKIKREPIGDILLELVDDIKKRAGIMAEPEKEEPMQGLVKISKRGPKTPSDEDKLKALKKWAQRDSSVRLEDFLDDEFGSEGGVLNVKPSTFHGWRRDLRDRKLIP